MRSQKIWNRGELSLIQSCGKSVYVVLVNIRFSASVVLVDGGNSDILYACVSIFVIVVFHCVNSSWTLGC